MSLHCKCLQEITGFLGQVSAISAGKTCNICRDFPAICKYYRVFPVNIAEIRSKNPVISCKHLQCRKPFKACRCLQMVCHLERIFCTWYIIHITKKLFPQIAFLIMQNDLPILQICIDDQQKWPHFWEHISSYGATTFFLLFLLFLCVFKIWYIIDW